jgi:tetratricopeptide (TPR) repeat protein
MARGSERTLEADFDAGVGLAPTATPSPADHSRDSTTTSAQGFPRPDETNPGFAGVPPRMGVAPNRRYATARIVWDGVAGFLLAIPSVAKTLSLAAAVAFAALIAYAELTGQRVVIEPFEVPSLLRDSGFTSRTIANKLTDHIATIRATAKTSMRRKQFVSSSEAAPQILALGGGISLDAIFQYAREFLGREPVRIVGEIVTTREARDGPPQVHVTVRVQGKPPRTVLGPLTNLDALLLQSAEHIFLHTQPYVLASYLYEVDPKRCLEAIQYVLQNDPHTDDARAFNLWGLLLLGTGHPDGAVERFREAVRVSADSDILAHAYTNWAAALHRQGKDDEALEKVQRAIEADAAHADAYHVWGLVLATMEQRSVAVAASPAALDMFRRAIEVNPQFIPAYFSLAEAFERRNDLPAAIEQLRKAVDLDRGSAEGRVRLGRALIRARELGEARQHLERAVELHPTSFEAHNTLGIVLMRQGDFGAAAAQFASAKDVSPAEPSPYFNLGLIHRMSGDRGRAVQEFLRYLALSPDGPGADQARNFVAELRGNVPAPRRAAGG